MIGSEKTAGRRQAGKIKKPADFPQKGKQQDAFLGAVPPGFVPKRHALIFRNGERRCRLKNSAAPLGGDFLRFPPQPLHRTAALWGSGGTGTPPLQSVFCYPGYFTAGEGDLSRWEGDFCGEFAQGAEIGRQPRRPQAGERGAPAGGAPKAGEARRAAARSGTRAGFIGRRGCVLPYLRPAVRCGLPGHCGRWPAAGLPHRGSGAPGAESGRG